MSGGPETSAHPVQITHTIWQQNVATTMPSASETDNGFLGYAGGEENSSEDNSHHHEREPHDSARSRPWGFMKTVWKPKGYEPLSPTQHGPLSPSAPCPVELDEIVPKLDTYENGIRERIVGVATEVQAEEPTVHKAGPWARMKTVSWRYERVRSAVKRQQERGRRGLRLLWQQAEDWVLSALVGGLTACSGAFIEVAASKLADFRFGFCREGMLQSRTECCGGAQFTDLRTGLCAEGAPVGQSGWVHWSTPLLAYVVVGVSFAVLSAWAVRRFAPAARGSGIPEVKTILGGFVLSEVLAPHTLAVKVVGLALAVSSGMSLGKEGPMVHVACCWADLLSGLSPSYCANECKRRELLSAAAAAGVSTSFGAPIGGILFSLEEVSTFFPTPTLLKAFLAAAVAAVSLQALNPSGGSGKLTMFEFRYDQPVSVYEYLPFSLLGVVGGVVGSLLIALNLRVAHFRRSQWYARHVGPVREVAAVALLTAATSYPLVFTRPLSVQVIHEVFNHCPQASMEAYAGMCDGGLRVALLLVLAAAVRLLQTACTFGAGLPAGVFVPSLFIGACLGRAFGLATAWVDSNLWHFAREDSGPVLGVYAMVGAAAVLGGVCRVTISLVVIMFELTSSLQCVVPFMLAVLVAKATGDLLGHGLYDCYIALNGYPYLGEESPDETLTASDVMEAELVVISLAEDHTLSALSAQVRRCDVTGFPLVACRESMLVVGYVYAADILDFARAAEKQDTPLGNTRVLFSAYQPSPASTKTSPLLSPASIADGAGVCVEVDMSRVVDYTVMQLVPDAPLPQLHSVFRQLGCRLLFVVRRGRLEGLVTKKQFLLALQRRDPAHPPPPPAPAT